MTWFDFFPFHTPYFLLIHLGVGKVWSESFLYLLHPIFLPLKDFGLGEPKCFFFTPYFFVDSFVGVKVCFIFDTLYFYHSYMLV